MHILLLMIHLCFALSSSERVLHKCCPIGEELTNHGECVSSVPSSNSSAEHYGGIDSSIVYFSDSDRPRCEYWESMVLDWNATDRFSLIDNGSLVLSSQTNGEGTRYIVFNSSEFCADVIQSSRRRVVKLCPCDRIICLRKCCPFGYVYNFSAGQRCIKSNETWQHTLVADSVLSDKSLTYDVLEDRMPKCDGFHNFASTAFVPQDLLDGYWWAYPTGKAHQGRQLCKDLVLGGRFEISVICEEVSAWDRVLKPVWHVPAALLLAMTLATLALCAELRAGTHGRALCCHAAALLVVNVVLALNAKHTFFGARHEAYVALRKGADIIVHYFVWAAAFWLNAICINIGLGFRTSSTTRSPDEEIRKFLWFCVYGWGCPVIVTTVVVILRSLPHSAVPFLYKPTMIETRSGHYELEGLLKLSSFAYYFAPMSLLLIINLVMFAFTSSKVWELQVGSRMLTKYRTETKTEEDEEGRGIKKPKAKKISVTDAPQNKNQSSRLAENTKSMLLYVRLLWTMGVLEMVVEIATWATNHFFWYEATMDVVDLLRAVCIFSLTCCKRRVLRLLRDRLKDCALLRRLRGLHRAEEYEMGSAGTSSTSTRARRLSHSATTGPSDERPAHAAHAALAAR